MKKWFAATVINILGVTLGSPIRDLKKKKTILKETFFTHRNVNRPKKMKKMARENEGDMESFIVY